jgi:DNA helicase-2/ATP-dependent DNA helicase PcrA
MSETRTFDQEFARLNEAQRQAVETIEGPLMVLAGPGTGKTQVVAMRVANILKRTQVRPSNILCLTYSTSGATAMRERLRRLIGPDAYGVTVTTIHGFCNEVILSHPEVFDERCLNEQVTDVRRFRLMNALIDQLPMGAAIINPKDPYDRTGDILARISQCKREGVSPVRVRQVADAYTVAMQGKSKAGTKAQARNEKSAQQCQEFATLYASYEAQLREEGLYDYDDMITAATEALRAEDWLLASLQERYQYVLVDEVQDTNGAQHALIEALTTVPEAVGEPNLCVVGDDDQAIYRFQGANVSGMLQIRERFPTCPIVTLTVSYRTTQPILDAAGRLIACNEERLVTRLPDLSKDLRSARVVPDALPPRLVRPVSDAVEPFVLAELIQDQLAAGVRPSEIAIITRKNDELFELYEVLRGLDIPAQVSGKLNLLHHTKVKQAITLLRAVHDLRDDHALASALGCGAFACHPADLARLWTLQREQNAGREREAKLRLVDVIADLETGVATRGLQLHDQPAVIRARDLLIDARNKTETLTLPELLERLLRESHLLPADPQTADPLDVVALTEFFDHVKRRGYEDPRFTLATFLRDLDDREQYGLKLQYDVPHLIDDGVQLLTAHGSKGLEFEVVLVAHFREKHWDHRRALVGLALPDDELFGGPQTEGLEDERRLAYVAWSRAKRLLVLSCPERVLRGEREIDASPSAFAIEGGPLTEEVVELRDATKASLLVLPKHTVDGALAAFLRSRLETFELSVTALNHFLEDPQIFLERDLLGLPQAKSSTLAYGTAVHEGLLAWAQKAKASGTSELEPLLTGFREAMLEREIVTDAERQRLLHLGEVSLQRYYHQRLMTPPILLGLEKKLTARLGEARLKGLIDRLDLQHVDGAKVTVIDYKTGRPKTERDVREADGGSLFRQLAFYRLLIERSPQMVGYEPVAFILEFIGERDEEPKSLSFQVTDAELRDLERVIEQVWAKIQALDFTPIPMETSSAADGGD